MQSLAAAKLSGSGDSTSGQTNTTPTSLLLIGAGPHAGESIVHDPPLLQPTHLSNRALS
ncbi:MAG: hypothetical protein ACI8S6_000475 [Myxococcota bacterium]|jgi:hypothetical protein